MYNVEQQVIDLLEKHPKARKSYNVGVFSYWITVDGLGSRTMDFAQITPLETICRALRTVWGKRPDLDHRHLTPEMETELQEVQEVFNGVII